MFLSKLIVNLFLFSLFNINLFSSQKIFILFSISLQFNSVPHIINCFKFLGLGNIIKLLLLFSFFLLLCLLLLILLVDINFS